MHLLRCVVASVRGDRLGFVRPLNVDVGERLGGEFIGRHDDLLRDLCSRFGGPSVRFHEVLAPEAPCFKHVALCAEHEEIRDANCMRIRS